MFVPFFTVDDDLTALSKMKILLLIRRIRNVDIFVLVLWVLFPLINFIHYILVKGLNDPLVIFNPIHCIFKGITTYSGGEWNTPFGFLNVALLIFSFCLRSFYGRVLYVKMKSFEEKSGRFAWERKSRFWLMIFVPGLSFKIYTSLFTLTNLQTIHQYNL